MLLGSRKFHRLFALGNDGFVFGFEHRPAYLTVNRVVRIDLAAFLTKHSFLDVQCTVPAAKANDTGFALPRKKSGRRKPAAACTFIGQGMNWGLPRKEKRKKLLVDQHHLAVWQPHRESVRL